LEIEPDSGLTSNEGSSGKRKVISEAIDDGVRSEAPQSPGDVDGKPHQE
jgi:hypothetical protein